MRDLFERALNAILARVFTSHADEVEPRRIAVAYSGGLDSSILLRLCAEFSRGHGLTVYAFHVHHGLSPNADAWADHCREAAARHDLVYQEARILVNRADPRGIEEAARVARYAALATLCRRYNVRLLLTAHHENDQAETLILQLARGAGLGGLAGMPEFQAGHSLLGEDLVLARPLLKISRQRLATEAEIAQIPYVEDESNYDPRYRRNAVRLAILPAMENAFPGCSTAITRSAQHLQSASILLDDLALIDLAACKAKNANALLLEPLRLLTDERAANLLRYWIRSQNGSPLSQAQLAELCSQMFSATEDAQPFLDGGSLRFWRYRGALYAVERPEQFECMPTRLKWRGEDVIDIPAWHGRLLFQRDGGHGLSDDLLMHENMRLLPRSGGERLKISVNRPSKSIKSLYQENAVPPWQRQRLPLVYIDDALVFAAGIGMDVRYLVKDGGLVLRWENYSCRDGKRSVIPL